MSCEASVGGQRTAGGTVAAEEQSQWAVNLLKVPKLYYTRGCVCACVSPDLSRSEKI